MHYQAHKIILTDERACRVCHKKIGNRSVLGKFRVIIECLLNLFLFLFFFSSSAFAYYPTGEILHYYCCQNLTSPPSSEHTTPRHSPTPEDNLLQRYWPDMTHFNSHVLNMRRWFLPHISHVMRMSLATCTCWLYHTRFTWWVIKCHVHMLVIPRAFSRDVLQVI